MRSIFAAVILFAVTLGCQQPADACCRGRIGAWIASRPVLRFQSHRRHARAVRRAHRACTRMPPVRGVAVTRTVTRVRVAPLCRGGRCRIR